MSPESLIPSGNENERSEDPDISCRFKNIMFQISGLRIKNHGDWLFEEPVPVILSGAPICSL